VESAIVVVKTCGDYLSSFYKNSTNPGIRFYPAGTLFCELESVTQQAIVKIAAHQYLPARGD
jgi:hypothetical protein